MSKLVLYSQPDCPPCEYAKRYFEDSGIPYIVKDIKKDKEARNELIHKYHSFSTPTFVINDDVIIIGFDQEKIKEALNIE
ncbi:glutaredoxin domain-containing protein [Bacillus massilinigeriensis]|uniref:glutaredoxin domain-containing protein n=1 Tax=Bacillus massilionigeriensis TaxID=1805475 RepID=UPI00096B4684|nr:glutaredoxin domain-containing protein [Bacillus massilionigeriensis]